MPSPNPIDFQYTFSFSDGSFVIGATEHTGNGSGTRYYHDSCPRLDRPDGGSKGTFAEYAGSALHRKVDVVVALSKSPAGGGVAAPILLPPR